MFTRILPILLCLLLAPAGETFAGSAAPSWPGETWEISTPAREGLDEQAMLGLDEEFRSGKHGYVDSMLIARNGGPVMYGTWGGGGQFGLIVPSLHVVAVFTGWNVYDESDPEYAFKPFYDRIVIPSR